MAGSTDNVNLKVEEDSRSVNPLIKGAALNVSKNPRGRGFVSFNVDDIYGERQGTLSNLEQQTLARLRQLDRNKDGRISFGDFEDLIAAERDAVARESQLRLEKGIMWKVVLALLVFMIVLAGVMGGIVYAVVEASKDTEADSSGVMRVAGSPEVVKVDSASIFIGPNGEMLQRATDANGKENVVATAESRVAVDLQNNVGNLLYVTYEQLSQAVELNYLDSDGFMHHFHIQGFMSAESASTTSNTSLVHRDLVLNTGSSIFPAIHISGIVDGNAGTGPAGQVKLLSAAEAATIKNDILADMHEHTDTGEVIQTRKMLFLKFLELAVTLPISMFMVDIGLWRM